MVQTAISIRCELSQASAPYSAQSCNQQLSVAALRSPLELHVRSSFQ
jgi:hypothetical protein